MKKKILLSLLTASIATSALADCRDFYERKAYEARWTRSSEVYGPLAGPVVLGAILVTSSPLAVLILPAGAAVVFGHDAVAVQKYNQMLKLIDQSYTYQQTGKAGKLLNKTFAKIEDTSVNLKTLADSIVKANENGQMCAGLEKKGHLKKDLRDGKLDFRVVEIDDEDDAPTSSCKVVSEPNSYSMAYWGTATRDNAVEHFAAKNGITLVATGKTPDQLPAGTEYDYAIVESSTREEYRSFMGVPKYKKEYFFDIVDNSGKTVASIKTLTQRVEVGMAQQNFGNFEGKGIKKAMKAIKELCSNK